MPADTPGTDDDLDLPPEDERPEVDPDVAVLEVRGEKQIGFKGMKHLEMTEEKKDKIHEVYADIIIELDDIKDQYTGADRAWQIGRVIDEYGVQHHDNMTLTDLGAFNTIEDMYARRLQYACGIYEFWPGRQYDPRHSIAVLGELASRAMNNERDEQARKGYRRLMERDEPLKKPDVSSWYMINRDASMSEIVEVVAGKYKTPQSIAESVKRVILLLNRPLDSVSKEDVKTEIQNTLKSGEG